MWNHTHTNLVGFFPLFLCNHIQIEKLNGLFIEITASESEIWCRHRILFIVWKFL